MRLYRPVDDLFEVVILGSYYLRLCADPRERRPSKEQQELTLAQKRGPLTLANNRLLAQHGRSAEIL